MDFPSGFMDKTTISVPANPAEIYLRISLQRYSLRIDLSSAKNKFGFMVPPTALSRLILIRFSSIPMGRVDVMAISFVLRQFLDKTSLQSILSSHSGYRNPCTNWFLSQKDLKRSVGDTPLFYSPDHLLLFYHLIAFSTAVLKEAFDLFQVLRRQFSSLFFNPFLCFLFHQILLLKFTLIQWGSLHRKIHFHYKSRKNQSVVLQKH